MARSTKRTAQGTFAKALTCDQCQVTRINGTPTHETGCPVAWKDYKVECKECGTSFTPETKDQKFCDDSCYCAHYGLSIEED